MMRRGVGAAAALGVLLAVLVACGEPTAPRAGACEVEPDDGTTRHTQTIGGQERAYHLYVPENLEESEPPAVVFLLHGLGQEPANMLWYSDFTRAADDHRFVIVAPLGAGPGPGWDVDGVDPAFLTELAGAVTDRLCADPERLYLAGFSYGSMMTFALACDPSSPFAAYGGVGAIIPPAGCDGSPPASFIYFHGTADVIVPYAGGPTPVGVADPVADSVRAWAEHADCGEPAAFTTPTEAVQQWRWECPDAVAEAFVIVGGEHVWPGSVLETSGTDSAAIPVSATDEMVRFFGLAASP